MRFRLLLTASACVIAGGCAKHSATVVDSDPFMQNEHQTQVATVTERHVPPTDKPAEVAHVPAVPDGNQVRQTAFIDRNGPQLVGAEVSNPATATPDKSEWWKAPAAVDATADGGIQIPPATSAQGRVGTASISYGMGQISRP